MVHARFLETHQILLLFAQLAFTSLSHSQGVSDANSIAPCACQVRNAQSVQSVTFLLMGHADHVQTALFLTFRFNIVLISALFAPVIRFGAFNHKDAFSAKQTAPNACLLQFATFAR
jgi:hypothetical protein